MSFAVPIEVTFRVVASGSPATIETAEPITVQAAVVHMGLRGEPGLQGLRGLQGLKGDKGDIGDVTPAAVLAGERAEQAATSAAANSAIAVAKATEASESASSASADASTATIRASEAAASSAATLGLQISAESSKTAAETAANTATYQSTQASIYAASALADKVTATTQAGIATTKAGEAAASAAAAATFDPQLYVPRAGGVELSGHLSAIGGAIGPQVPQAQEVPGIVKTTFNASGDAPMYACRAWVNFTGKGTVSIRGSGNVSSITDNGVGDYTVNFITPMPSANYAAIISGRLDASSDANFLSTFSRLTGTPLTATSVRVSTGAILGGPSASFYDADHVTVAVFC